jgi:galactokinase
MAIERYAVMAADRSTDGKNVVQIRDTSGAEPVLIDLSAPVQPGTPKWGNYPRGVIAGCLARGMNPGGLDVLLHSTVPLGGGLSSSAALEVCTATLIEAVTGKKIDPVEKALLCQKAEHQFAGVPCGIMDQFISVMGRQNHLLLLDCRSRKTELVPMSDAAVSAAHRQHERPARTDRRRICPAPRAMRNGVENSRRDGVARRDAGNA